MPPSDNKPILAVIFDMDGVLIDAKEWHFEALNRALGLFGYSITRHDHLVTYDGLPTRKKLQMLSLERGLPEELHEFIGEMKQRYTTEIIASRCRPRFAHEYALSRLKANGYSLAVASNSIRSTVDLMLSHAHVAKYFDVTLSNEDVNDPKPSPEIYITACHRLGIPPEQALVVEDNDNGIRAARAAGTRVMTVASIDDVHLDAIMSQICHLEGLAS